MSNPIIRIHNTFTNEIIDREMTDAEYETYKANKEAQEIEEEAKAKAKAAAETKLAALGLTPDDLAALGL